MLIEVKTSPPQEFKVDVDAGTFEGYAAAYGNIDEGNDRILAGAGAHIGLANPTLPIYFSHGWLQNERPIGKSLYFEDRPQGLFTKGKMFDTPAGSEVLIGMREGVIGAMSIGYTVPADGKRFVKEEGRTVREISKFNLNEYSICATGFAMNDRALITTVKGGRLMVAEAFAKTTRIDGAVTAGALDTALQEALREVYPGADYVWVRDHSASAVLYLVENYDTEQSTLYQQGYTADADGSVTLLGDATEVEEQTTYTPVTGKATGKTDLTDALIPSKDYRELRGFVEKADPIALLLDEATYLNELTKSLKAEGREDEVRQALQELDSAALLLKGICAVNDIEIEADNDILALIRATTQNIHAASQALST